jgi:hypothetical protein
MGSRRCARSRASAPVRLSARSPCHRSPHRRRVARRDPSENRDRVQGPPVGSKGAPRPLPRLLDPGHGPACWKELGEKELLVLMPGDKHGGRYARGCRASLARGRM